MKLNLGCGLKVMPVVDGWMNHDRKMHDGVDIEFDIMRQPWPLSAGMFEHIMAHDVLEHIPACGLIPVMDECWRLLKVDGTMEVKVPAFGSTYHLSDLTHCTGFSERSFDILDPTTEIGRKNPWYTDRYWRVEKRERRGENWVFVLRKM